jgi:nucleoid-associated protein YgaU
MGLFADWFDYKSDAPEEDDHATVTVKRGDSLYAIAQDLTGDGNRWKELADANPDKQWTETYIIQPGEELRVPKSWL